jgi:phage-related protein (TIGR01555 family)
MGDNFDKLDALETRVAEQEKTIRQMHKTAADGWANVLVGLGGKQDKRKSTHFDTGTILQATELEAMYLGDGIAARVIDVVADDMTREWIDLEGEEDDDDAQEKDWEKLDAELRRLQAQTHFNTALKWKRLYGGALIIMGALDGQALDTPLNAGGIKQIDSLRVIDPQDVDIGLSTFQTDPTKKDFGQPLVFSVWLDVGGTRTVYKIHASRCLVFHGKAAPTRTKSNMSAGQAFWGLSEIQSVYEILKDFGASNDSVTNILFEFVIGKYKLQGLADMMAAGNTRAVVTRMEIIGMMKSVIHSILLDSEEDYTRDSVALGGVAEVLDRFMMRLSGATGVPVTRLFGRSPAGMNATGESDTTNYYDMVRSQQRNDLQPPLQQLVNLVRASLKMQGEASIEFNPLFQLTEKEEADVEKLKAEAEAQRANMYKTYVDAGVLDAEDVFLMEWAERVAESRTKAEALGLYTPPTEEEIQAQAELEAQAKANAEVMAKANAEKAAAEESAPGQEPGAEPEEGEGAQQ